MTDNLSPNDVLVVAGLSGVWGLHVADGSLMGSDELWFMIEQIVHHGPHLVIHGTEGGIACYRNGMRVWGVAGVNRDPKAFLTEQDAWTTDAHGRPTKRAGTLTCHKSVALVLGDSAAQIDRTQQG
jgi:hypothetical protein